MKLSQVNIDKLDNELIKTIFFNIIKEKYTYADYVIIYGFHIKEFLNERLNYALKVLNNQKYSKVVLTGGIGVNGDFHEAEYMKNYLVNNMIDESKIIIENSSKTTEENNINIMNMLDLKTIDKPTNIVLITHEPHLLRIILHWSKILNNSNIRFYYDYVENSVLSYENIIANEEFIAEIKRQIVKTQKLIKEDRYIDFEIYNR